MLGPQVFGVNPGSADACEPEVKGFGIAGIDLSRPLQLWRWIGGVELGQRSVPVFVEIVGRGEMP